MTSPNWRAAGNSTPSLNGELSYPTDETPLSELLRNAFWNPWANTPQRDNDGTADSVITAVTAASDTYTVTAGPAFVEGQLVRPTGFTAEGDVPFSAEVLYFQPDEEGHMDLVAWDVVTQFPETGSLQIARHLASDVGLSPSPSVLTPTSPSPS